MDGGWGRTGLLSTTKSATFLTKAQATKTRTNDRAGNSHRALFLHLSLAQRRHNPLHCTVYSSPFLLSKTWPNQPAAHQRSCRDKVTRVSLEGATRRANHRGSGQRDVALANLRSNLGAPKAPEAATLARLPGSKPRGAQWDLLPSRPARDWAERDAQAASLQKEAAAATTRYGAPQDALLLGLLYRERDPGRGAHLVLARIRGWPGGDSRALSGSPEARPRPGFLRVTA